MKREMRLFLVVTCLMMAFGLSAQNGLHINRLFDGRYQKSKKSTEILVTGKKAQSIDLSVYHSVAITNDDAEAEKIEALVKKDGAAATEKEEEYRKGRLYYGFYELKPIGKENRYIFYLNQTLANRNPVDKVTIIYMEGKATATYIKNLIRK